MNWGKKILFLYLGFVAIIVTLMVISIGSKSELEYSDYYKRELGFQEQIDASNNANNLKVAVDYTISGRQLEIGIPVELLTADLSGSIDLLRPSDSRLDKSFPLQTNSSGIQLIDLSKFVPGVYKMGVWASSAQKKYYKEAIITLK